MKSTELMIGNCVQDEHGITQYVYRIWNGGAELVETINGDDDLDYPEDEIFPIPLTEEWLLKFGFEECDSRIPYFRKQSLVTYKQDGIFWIDYYNTCIELYHVHQLQNLFFALTNEELTFKIEYYG